MPEKSIALQPVTGWTTGTLPEGNVLMVLEFVMAPSDLATGTRHEMRFAMTSAQCGELAQTLLRKAALSRARETDAPPNGRPS